jgi:outer membrane protein assembly factor BamB
VALTIALLSMVLVCAATAQEWPQWGGPNRNKYSAETGLLKKWPAGGPKLLWTYEKLPPGYSTVAVAGGRIYTTGTVRNKEKKTCKGYVLALDLAGKLLWKTEYGPEWARNFQSARTTPTVVGNSLYVMSGAGTLACLDAKKGKVQWSLDTAKEYETPANRPRWGGAESVLVDGDKVICTPGGKRAAMIAVNRKTGKVVWASKGGLGLTAYCSPLLIREGKKNLIVQVLSHHIVGFDAASGRVLWKHPFKNQWEAHANTPIYANGLVYVTAGYDHGGVALKLSADGTSITQAWKDKTLDTHHGGVVLVNGHIYGASWRGNGNGNWVCIDFSTGNPCYDTHWEHKGSIVYADGMLYCYNEKGSVGLVPATPKKFEVRSSFKVTKGSGPHWAHPVVAGGRLYIRHGHALMAYDIKAR